MPVDQLFQPWLLSAADQERFQVRIGNGLDYPKPLPEARTGGTDDRGVYNAPPESSAAVGKGGSHNKQNRSANGGRGRGGDGRSFSSAAEVESYMDRTDIRPRGKDGGPSSKFSRVQHF